MRTRFISAILGGCHGVGLAAVVSLPAGGQTRVLGPATATHRAEFTSLTSIRELGDGRVVLTDFRENRLMLADLATGAILNIGRPGDGPEEYLRTLPLFAIGGDSSLMYNVISMRWTIVVPGRPLSTLAADHPIVAFMQQRTIHGTDAAGHLLTTARTPRRPGQTRDTSFLILVSRPTAKADTIGRVDVGKTPGPPLPANFSGPEMLPAYPVGTRSVLARDGWVAVLYYDPYHVDWRSSDGRWVRGATIPDPVIKVDTRQKEAFLAARRGGGGGGGPPVLVPGVATGPAPPPPNYGDWPEAIPPFTLRSNPIATQNGEVVILRTPTADIPTPPYDVIDRRGVRVFQLALPANKRLLGFGKSSAYVITTNDDGIQTLSRHAWPPR